MIQLQLQKFLREISKCSIITIATEGSHPLKFAKYLHKNILQQYLLKNIQIIKELSVIGTTIKWTQAPIPNQEVVIS